MACTIRQIAYEFLLAFHSKYGSILYHFRDKAKCWLKIAILFTPRLHFTPPLRGPHQNSAIRFGTKKPRAVWLVASQR